jgi:hypothetical protein
MAGGKRDFSKDQKRRQMQQHGIEASKAELGRNIHGLVYDEPPASPNNKLIRSEEKLRQEIALAAAAYPKREKYRIVKRGGNDVTKPPEK